MNKHELEAYVAELETELAEAQQIIDSKYELRTVWYRGREWVCGAEVHALVRDECGGR